VVDMSPEHDSRMNSTNDEMSKGFLTRNLPSYNKFVEVVKARRNQFTCAIIGLAFSRPSSTEFTIYYGFIQFTSGDSPSNLDYTYDNYRFVITTMSINDALNLVKNLMFDGQIKGLIPNSVSCIVKCFHNERKFGSKDQYGSVEINWPYSYWELNITEPKIPTTANSNYLSGKNLPFFPTFRHAIFHLLGLKEDRYTTSVPKGKIELVVPDYTGRLNNIKILENEILLNFNITKSQDISLCCKLFVKCKNRTYNFQSLLRNCNITFKIEDNPDKLYILLVDTDEVQIDFVEQYLRGQLPDWIIKEYSEWEVSQFLDEGENDHMEYKLKIPRGQHMEFLKSVSAFANTKGGTILVGVDDNANVVGCTTREQRIYDIISSNIEPDIQVTVVVSLIDEKSILIIDVPEGVDKPYIVKDHGPYKRVGATNKSFSRYDLDMIQREREKIQY
jgi:hypothetical protein